ncbi:MAG TPA: 5'-deoxynucleotidase [Bacillota bacterium]
MSHFFAYLARMKHIRRWGLMRNTLDENIQEHSLQVAMIAHCLALVKNRFFGGKVNPETVAVLAMYHEVSEVITGDLATPIKYFNPEIRTAYQAIEGVAKKRLYTMLPEQLQDSYAKVLFAGDEDEAERQHHELVKAADKIAAYLKCLEELKAGNQEFSKAEKTLKAQIDSMGLQEVSYFMEQFAPSFNLTLDELE